MKSPMVAVLLVVIVGVVGAVVLGSALINLNLYLWFGIVICTGYIAIARRSNVLLGVASFFCGLFIIEAGAALYELSPLGREHTGEYIRSAKFRKSDPLLRSRLIPSTVVSESKVFGNNDFAYRDVTYVIDEKSRRATTDPSPGSGEAEQHILFMGCSFTFGTGVEQDQTLPSRFQALAGRRYKAYNYGEGGYGPSQTLLLLQRDLLFDDVSPNNGIAVYSFIEDHLNRCTPHVLNKFLGSFASSPLYRIDKSSALAGPYKSKDDPRLVRIMRFYEAARRISPLFRLLDKRLEFYYVTKEDAYRVAAEILIAARREYKRQFDGEFFVLLWPRVTTPDKYLNEFIAHLNESGIQTIRVSDFPDPNRSRIHSLDYHPSALEYEWVAQKLYEHLNKEK